MTCNIQPDLIEDHISTQIVTSDHGSLEEEEETDIPEPDEADVSHYISPSLVRLLLLQLKSDLLIEVVSHWYYFTFFIHNNNTIENFVVLYFIVNRTFILSCSF